MDIDFDEYYIDRAAPRDRLEVVPVPADATSVELVQALVADGMPRGEAEAMVREQLARSRAAAS